MTAITAQADVRTWIGNGVNNLASTPENWVGAVAPVAGDNVVFDATSSANCDWDLDIVPVDWIQTTDYAGTVTLRTRYPGQGSFTNLTISGNADVQGGVWTHPANSGVDIAADRLSVSVGGDFTLGQAAIIDLYGRGFAAGRGPGAGITAQRNDSRAVGASHGGAGGHGDATTPIPTYGCPFRPDTLGSSGDRRGGGNLNLAVGGTATLDGTINANGDSASNTEYQPGTGGSVLLQAGAFAGGGTITACGNNGYRSSGGGRIALVSTASTDDPKGALTLSARAGTLATGTGATGGGRGTVGTIYLETPASQRLILNAEGVVARPGLATMLIWPLATDPHPALTNGIAADVRLELVNGAFVRLFADWRMAELAIEAGSTLYLHGYTLYLQDSAPGGDFPDLSEPSSVPVTHAALGGGTLAPEGGRLLWDGADPTFRVPISTGGSEGTIANFDADTYYDFDTPLTITATPAAGHGFVRWIGTLPEAVDPTEAELTLTVKPELHLRALFASTAANTSIWIGGEGSDQKASTAANWYPAGVPQSGDHIVLSGAAYRESTWDATPLHRNNEYRDNYDRLSDWFAHSSVVGYWHGTRFRSPYHIEDEVRYASPSGMHGIAINWDIEIEPASWRQTEWFSGWVTFPIRYPAVGGYTNLVISSHVTLDGGYWTHVANTGDHAATERLAVQIGGDFSLGEWGRIELKGRGYAGLRGPAPGVSGQRAGKGASHGGQGGYHFNQEPSPGYGTVTRPDTLGSGGHSRGGGALWMITQGDATLNGVIRADGQSPQRSDPDRYPGGAGGSVFLQAATVSGSGTVMAPGGWGYYSGGGGRVAVVATNGPALGNIDMIAPGGHPPTAGRGSVGTVYRKTIYNGETKAVLLIDPRNLAAQSGLVTEVPASLETFELHPVVGGELEDVTLVVTNLGRARLTSSLRMGDFTWIGPLSTLEMKGSLLYLKADEPEPLGSFPANQGGGVIDYDGGNIIWGNAASEVLLTLEAGPDGDVTRDPEAEGGLHPFESTVTVTALPDPGYDFVLWEGDVPPGQDRTNSTLTVFMNADKTLRAIFASADPMTRTWMGGESGNILASNDANWYPSRAPTNGVHIVFNSNRTRAIDWNLDIEVASWTQQEGFTPAFDPVTGQYYGRVTILTRYPNQGGTFTNLHISGDVRLYDGEWTHVANSGDHEAVDRLSVSVGQSLILGVNATLDVSGRGYAAGRGPGAGTTTQRGGAADGRAAAHGGIGGYGDDLQASPTYGSAFRPDTLGSSGSHRGGGNVQLTVADLTMIDGVINADGDSQGPIDYHPGAGGSVLIRSAAFGGTGSITARGNSGYRSSGGGRIALISAQPIDDPLGELTLSACAGTSATTVGGQRPSAGTGLGTPGTIYLETPVSTRLILNAEGVNAQPGLATPLVPAAGLTPDGPADFKSARMRLEHRARVILTRPELRIRDLERVDADATLFLDGYDLYVRNPYHPFSDDPAAEALVIDDSQGGALIWARPATLLMVR